MSASADSSAAAGDELDGCTVVVTRERRGELGRQLEERGAQVVHVPLIEVVDASPADRAALAGAFRDVDWAVVTSPAGAERIVESASAHPRVRLAAVGTATAQTLTDAGCRVDLVPDRQIGAALADAFCRANPEPVSVLVAQADRAGGDLAERLAAEGHEVKAVTAYHTVTRQPSAADLQAIGRADAVSFASGSAAQGWAEALGADAATTLPSIVAVIGPSTAAATWENGLKVTDIAADHSIAGLVEAVVLAWRHR